VTSFIKISPFVQEI